MSLLYILLALIAGACLPVQGGINNTLKDWTNHTLIAALISFAGGTLTLAIIVFAARLPLPHLAAIGQTKWWHFTGGLFGAFVVSVIIFLVPRLGAVTILGLAVTGQMVASLVLDHYGLLGYPVQEITPLRLLGVALLICGVMLIRLF